MARVLFFVILAVVLLSWLNKGRTSGDNRRTGRSDSKKPGQHQQPALENMVRCAHCGVHLPQREAVSQGAHWFCSDLHRRQGPATAGHTK